MCQHVNRYLLLTSSILCWSLLIGGCTSELKPESGSTTSGFSTGTSIRSQPLDSAESECSNYFSNFDEWDGMEATEEKLLAMSDECRDQLTYVGLRNGFSDHAMEALAGSKNLRKLNLADNRKMTEQGLLKIGTFDSLENLVYIAPQHDPPYSIWTRPVLTRRVFAALATLQQFERIFVSSHLLDDNLFETLKTYPALKRVSIRGRSPLTGEALRHIAEVKQLQSLSFHARDWDGSGLRHLAKLPQLQILGLDRNAITDEAMQEIGQLEHLEILDLGETDITDAGMEAIAGLKNLRQLHVDGTAITGKSLAIIEQLPNLESLAAYDTIDGAKFTAYMRDKSAKAEAKP